MIARRHLLALAAATLALPAGTSPARAATPPREIAYGPAPAQRLDLYPQARLRGAPVIVFVHGGGWINGDKCEVFALPAYAERHGCLLVSVNYRLLPQAADAGDCARDVAAAVAWVQANAGRFGGDPRRIFLVGHSAGAHLAALLVADPAYLAAAGMASPGLAGAVLLDGLYYDAVPVLRRQALTPGVAPDWLIAAVGRRPHALSPARQARPGRRYPPTLVIYAGRRSEARREAADLTLALRAAGAPVEALRAFGDTHGRVNKTFGLAGDPEGERAARFIRTGRL